MLRPVQKFHDERRRNAGPQRGSIAIRLGAAALAVAALGLWIWRAGAAAPTGAVTVAVMPFESIGMPPEQEYLADALHDETITTLGQIDPEHLVVIGRQPMLAYADTTKSLRQIGEELGAAYLLESGVRAENGRVRITARFVRARDQA